MADTKPIYKRVNGEWKKQTAFQRQNGEWVKISGSETTELEYIESTGTQYIDTGVLATTTTDYEFVGSITEETKTVWIAGAPTWIGVHKKANTVAITQTSSGHTYNNVNLNEVFTIGLFGNKAYFNGVETNTLTRNKSTLTLFLFAYHNSTNTPAMHAYVRMYSFKIWDNGELVRDFIPVLDLNNKPCLFDKVSETLFYNQGTGEFLYKEKDENVEITDLTGTTWHIPSGWTATAGYGDFYLEGSVTDGTNTYDNIYKWYIGYTFDAEAYSFIGKANTTVFEGAIFPKFTSTDSFTLTITGGTDATNTSLISWLQANAVQIQSAQVTVTNNSTSYDAEISWNGATENVVVSKNSTVTFTVPQGTNITILSTSGLMPAWNTTSVVGDCVDNSTTGGDFIINGDCSIIGYPYDADESSNIAYSLKYIHPYSYSEDIIVRCGKISHYTSDGTLISTQNIHGEEVVISGGGGNVGDYSICEHALYVRAEWDNDYSLVSGQLYSNNGLVTELNESYNNEDLYLGSDVVIEYVD